MSERFPPNPHREALGVALSAIGAFTGWKAVAKYFIIFGALYAGNEWFELGITKEKIFDVLHSIHLGTNLDYPLSVFVSHVNSISPQRAVLEGVAIATLGFGIQHLGNRISQRKT